MTLHAIYFRVTDKADPQDKLGVAGPKSFELDLTYTEADDLRDRLLRLEVGGLVTDVDFEPVRIHGKAAPVHELLDAFDPKPRRTP
jgi:hypothetical protein